MTLLPEVKPGDKVKRISSDWGICKTGNVYTVQKVIGSIICLAEDPYGEHYSLKNFAKIEVPKRNLPSWW